MAPLSRPEFADSSCQYEDDLQSDILPSAMTVDADAHIPLGRRTTGVGWAEHIFDARSTPALRVARWILEHHGRYGSA